MSFLNQPEHSGEKVVAQEPKQKEPRRGGMATLEEGRERIMERYRRLGLSRSVSQWIKAQTGRSWKTMGDLEVLHFVQNEKDIKRHNTTVVKFERMKEARIAQEQEKWKKKEWVPKAVELYQSGTGIKAIAFQLGQNHTRVRNGLVWAGVYKGMKAEDISSRMSRRKAWNANALIMEEYEEEKLSAILPDVLWSRHKEVSRYRALASYYRNHEERKAQQRKKAAKLYEISKTNPAMMMKRKLRFYVWKYCKFGHKSKSTGQLLGCTWDQFRKHIQSQFDERMSWANYGSYWHIDHIMPCTSFDLSKPEQQAVCFHFTNMRPMEAKANISKSNWLPDGTKPKGVSLYSACGSVVIAAVGAYTTPGKQYSSEV